jgi:hypothetical protein
MKKGNCEKGNLECTYPMCTYASFPNANSPFDYGVPTCTKPDSFDAIYKPKEHILTNDEKLGPCWDVVCEECKTTNGKACDHCNLNPGTEEYEEENGEGD